MTIIQAEQIMLTDPKHERKPHDDRYAMGSAYVNGEYCGVHEAAVPLLDMGFAHADAAYDVVTVSKGQFFRLQDHLDRIDASCDKFLLTNPHSQAETAEILTNLVKLSGLQDAYVWWSVTRGFMPKDRGSMDFECRFYAYVTPYSFIAHDDQRSQGLDVMISEKFIRIPEGSVDPTAKNFHWMDMKMAMAEAILSGQDWSVLTDDQGFLTECPGSNIFFINDGELYTPDSGCLEGVTRKTVFDLAEQAGIPCHIQKVHKDLLLGADEAFMTSSAGGIMPINSVNGQVLGGVQGPGELSSKLHNLYWEKRWQGWLGTAVDYAGPVNI